MIVNTACPAIVNSFLNAGIRKIDRDAKALNDLLPNSPFLNSLAKADKPESTQYYILAGNFDPTRVKNPWYQLFAGLADVTLNTLFADHHDLFTPVSSVTSIKGKNIDIASVSCHHFQYFRDPECGQKLERWIGM